MQDNYDGVRILSMQTQLFRGIICLGFDLNNKSLISMHKKTLKNHVNANVYLSLLSMTKCMTILVSFNPNNVVDSN